MCETDPLFNLGNMEDLYLCGICCEKLGLTDLALATWPRMQDEERMRLFSMGVEDAPSMHFGDIADELWKMRLNREEGFDEHVAGMEPADRAAVEGALSQAGRSVCDKRDVRAMLRSLADRSNKDLQYHYMDK